MDDKTCNFLSEVDEYFSRGSVNERKFNNSKKYHSYCPYENTSKKNKCTNDYERINALGSYLFKEIMKIDKNFKGSDSDKRHIDVFMIWLGDKLFKIENDYKSTLEESYKKNLEKYVGNVKYWETINKKLYKDATIKKMSEFYNLLSQICKLINEYNTYIQNPKKHNRSRLGNYSAQCISYYRAIISSSNECRPYLRLLDNLKMIYENFRMQKMDIYSTLNSKEKGLLLNRVKFLTTFNDENKLFVTVTENLSFGDKECIGVKSKDEKIGEQIASKKSQDLGKSKNPARGTQAQVPGNAQRGNIGSTKRPAKPAPAKPVAVKPSLQSSPSEKDTKLKTPQAGKTHQSGPGDKVNGADDGKGGSGGGAGGGKGDTGSGAGGGKGDTGSGAGGGKGDAGSGVNGGGIVQGDQGKSSGGAGSGPGDHVDKGSQTNHSGDPSHGNQVPAQPAPASPGAGTTPSPVQPPPESQPQPQQKPADSLPTSLPTVPPTGSPPAIQQPDSSLQPSDPQKPDPPPQPSTADPAAPAQDGRSSQTSQTGGSSNQNEQNDSSNSKGGTGGTKDNKGDPNDGSKGPGDGSSDPASSISGGSFDWESSIFEFILKGKEYYDKTSEFIKDNQKKFKDAAEKISNAYNDTVENLKSAYNASSDYLNKFISDVTSQLNQVDPPKSGDNQTGPGNPSGGGNPTNQLPPSQPSTSKDSPSKDPPPNPPLNPAPGSSKGSSQQSQSLLQLQPITQQPTQTSSSKQIVGQLVKSLSSDLILKKPWNIFPTTWNGSGDCKPEIKFMNTTLICCTSEQCSLTGIPVTLVLIPIILLIAYKYLSFGSSQKSEKKNMNRVINFHDGNRKTKIIISSNDKKKKLKPVINSVGGKKGPLLNIYKLIRADPMPFINLFFLLIFFVYKRKRDTIE
ncbi:PIR protein CIR protein [Plasmodium vinckei]|uniref:PIR protein CIR protein n=1 Tax=Plasmodium vinckei TaxID=5860 RepID=A0A6V7SB70_PLAVN|nr:PIR protein CIR protein [Plasmodium vinckei]